MTAIDPRRLHLTVMSGEFAVCRLAPETPTLPSWAVAGHWYALTRTAEELSIACPADLVPAGVQSERDWCLLRLTGPFPFGLTGILAAVLTPLAEATVPIFAVSTFDTDYVLVKCPDRDAAIIALRGAGHRVDE